eukprot:scaffold39727_cov58-Phaeocystis_antarctica.AAC.1
MVGAPLEPTARSQAGRWGAATVASPANICTVASAGTASSADATCPATIAASASLGAADFFATFFTASFFTATFLTATFFTASFFGGEGEKSAYAKGGEEGGGGEGESVHVFVAQLQVVAQSVQHPAPDTELLQPPDAGPHCPVVKPPLTLAPQFMHIHDVCACTPLACSSSSTRQRRRDQAEATVAVAMAATATALEPMVAGRAAVATKMARAAAVRAAKQRAAAGSCRKAAGSAAAFLAACFAAGVGPFTITCFSRRVKATSSSAWSGARATLKFVEHAEARGTARGGSYVCTSSAYASASFGVVVSMVTAGVSSPKRSSNWPRTKAAGVAACISRLPRTGLAGLGCDKGGGATSERQVLASANRHHSALTKTTP